MTLYGPARKTKKTSNDDMCEEKSEDQWSKTGDDKTDEMPIFRRVRFSAKHGQDLTEFLTEVQAFTTWIYQNGYRKRSLQLVPSDVQETLHPQILRSLLRSFATIHRKQPQPPPMVLIRGKWINIDWVANCICISQIYRNRNWDLVLPIPQLGDTAVRAILWIKVDATDVEVVVGTDMPNFVVVQGEEES
jgi:hypothetical protein